MIRKDLVEEEDKNADASTIADYPMSKPQIQSIGPAQSGELNEPHGLEFLADEDFDDTDEDPDYLPSSIENSDNESETEETSELQQMGKQIEHQLNAMDRSKTKLQVKDRL